MYVLNLMMRRREGIGQGGGGSGGRGGGEGGWRTWIGADRSFRERVQARSLAEGQVDFAGMHVPLLGVHRPSGSHARTQGRLGR